MSNTLEQNIMDLEEKLGGKITSSVSTPWPIKSQIEPLITIYGSGEYQSPKKQKYFATKKECKRYRYEEWADPYYIEVSYYGTVNDCPDVIKINLIGWGFRSSHIYSPIFDESIYKHKILNNEDGKHLFLRRRINLSQIYNTINDLSVKTGINDNIQYVKK